MKLIGYNKYSGLVFLIVVLFTFGIVHSEGDGDDKLKHPVYTKIYSDPDNIFNPHISPNGKFIVFFSTQSDKDFNLFIIPSDGSKSPRQITTGKYTDVWPKWSPLGDKIVFQSSRSDNVSDIYTLEVSQETGLAVSEIKRITLKGGRFPEWSPDAKLILFSNFEMNTSTTTAYLIPSNGGLTKKIYSGRHLIWNWKFSPDGNIYFSKINNKREEFIYRISSNGGKAKLIYKNKRVLGISPKGDFLLMYDMDRENPDRGYFIGPSSGKGVAQKIPVLKEMSIKSWGNDEKFLISTKTEYSSILRVVNSYGGKYRELTDGRGYDFSPVWSPDGKSIAYTTQLNGSISIMIIPARGGAAKQIPTQNIINTNNLLSWSPNGKMLATRPVNRKGLLVIDLESKKEYLLSPQETIKYTFVWSNDSKSIYYQVAKNSKNYIKRVGLDGKATTILTSTMSYIFLYNQPIDKDKIYLVKRTVARDSMFLISTSLKSKQEKIIIGFKGFIEVSISPNGKLAVISRSIDKKNIIYLMSLDEQKPVKINSLETGHYLYDIKWNKESSRIFFIEGEESAVTNINSISINDRQKTIITESDKAPKWSYDISPDASQIVYTADVSKNSSIWKLDITEILKEYKNKLKK